MKKGMVAVVAVAGALAASSAVYACWGWGGGWGSPGYGQKVNTQSMRSFQRDTVKLRERLMDKQLDLQDELSKEVPDGKRVAALRREIMDIQNQLQAAADKYGMSGWGTGGNMGQHQSMPGGCGCGMYGW